MNYCLQGVSAVLLFKNHFFTVEEVKTLFFFLSGCLHAIRTIKTKLQEQDVKTVYPGSTWGVPLPHFLSGSFYVMKANTKMKILYE